MHYITPIIKYKTTTNNNIYIKREDLLPFSFGGNKVRIAEEYFLDMKKKNKDCIIGYGNARSNLCRVISNYSFSCGIPCYIVSPSDDNGTRINTNNSYMAKLCGAHFYECSKNNVAQSIEEVMKLCSSQGLNPYYIYGDKQGNGNEAVPVRAYVKVFEEILEQEKELGLQFDYIFIATGTGMTQAGLVAGSIINDVKKEIVGISIARDKENAILVSENYVEKYLTDINKLHLYKENIKITDDYVCGGYGKYTAAITKVIDDIYKSNGIPLDYTYTGKAFYGMQEYICKNKIKDKNILFIHTGGTPLYFDYLKEKQEGEK